MRRTKLLERMQRNVRAHELRKFYGLKSLKEVEAQAIRETLERTKISGYASHQNLAAAALILGIDRNSLWKKRKKYRIEAHSHFSPYSKRRIEKTA